METNSFGNKSFMHPMRTLSMPSRGDQFFSLRRGKGAIFWVLPLFAMRSQSTIIRFPQGSPSSQIVPPDVPNSTSILPLKVCPKFNSHVCKLKRLPIQEHICLYFSTWDPKRYFYWGMLNVLKKLVMGQSILPLPKHTNKM
jgi:hypothetical protein